MQPSSPPELASPPRLSPAELAAWRSFLRAHTVLTRVLERELVQSHGLPLAEYDVLVQLQEAPEGALRMAQLADRVLLSRSGLTRLVERLEHQGLVRRQICRADARGAFAVITEQGRRRLREAAPSHLRSVREHFAAALRPEQLEAVQEAMERLATAPGGCAQALAELAADGAAESGG